MADLVRRLSLGVPWLVAACSDGNAVQYVDGKCLIGGVVSSLAQVEQRQAAVTQHILARQPVLTAIAVAVVVVAGAGYVQRLLTVLAARRASSSTLGDRVRARMERYRAHPVRYFSILGATLIILIAAGAVYIQLDADKRASERALATLQFCHLALRSADEQHVLAQQRDNLAQISATAGDIRVLVDKLPPAEQQKAHEIVDQLGSALGAQRTLVTRYAAQADVSAHAVEQREQDVERGITKIDSEVGTLNTVPGELAKLGGAVRDLDTRHDQLGSALAATSARFDAIDHALADLTSRPPVVCPACQCAVAPAAASPGPAAPAPPPKPSTATSIPATAPAARVPAAAADAE